MICRKLRWAVSSLAMSSVLAFASSTLAQVPDDAEQGAPPPSEPAPGTAGEVEAPPPADPAPPPVAAPPPPSTPPPSTPPARVASPPPSLSTTSTTTTRRHTATETGRVSTGAAAAPAPAEEEEEEEEEGDGRDVDFIWFELEGGVSNVNLVAFRDANFASVLDGEPAFEELNGTGPFAGLGVGFRVFILAIGARVTYANYERFDIGNIGGDLTLRLPIPVVEPYARVGFGYAWQGQANYGDLGMSTTTVYGWSFDSALGVDIYLANWFTIGAGVGLNLLNMSRQRDPTEACMGATDICPGNPGDAVGYQLRGFAQIGFRF